MSSGGSSGSSTVTNKTEIDPLTKQWRQTVFNRGNELLNQGTPEYYPGNTVVPFSQQTQTGLNMLQGQAMNGAPNLDAANASASRALSGFNPAMPGAMNAAAGGLNNQNTAGLQGYGNANNPHLAGLFSQGARQVTDAVNGNFMQAGRFGANAAHTGALTQGLGDLYSSIYAPAYETERNRGLQAAGQMASIGADDRNRQLQGLDLMGGLWSQGNQDAARQQALLPSIYQYGAAPGQQLVNVGNAYENLAGEYLAADQDRYNYEVNAPWQYLGQFSGMMSGLPDFSSTTSTQRGPGTNRAMSGLGGAAAGAQLGSMFGPWGTGIGAGVGALGGLFG